MNQLEQLQQAARFALEVLLWTQAGEPVPSMEREAIKQLKTALQEPVEESVACMDMLRRARNLLSHPPTWSSENAASRHRLLEEIDAFITAPAQRKPLTEEEIKDCERQAMVNGALPFEQRVFFVRRSGAWRIY